MADRIKYAIGQKIAAVFQKFKTPVEEPCRSEDYTDRCQWDIIHQIEEMTLIEILRLALAKRHEAYRELPMKVVSTAQGSCHLVFMVKVRNPVSHKIEGWVVKIPGHGTPDRWTADDEYMLTQEFETMRLITTYTDVPAALVVDHCATLDNEFGFPYLVMKQLPGKSACDLCYDEHCKMPTPETEQKRLNCLRSLARHMTELDKLRFDQIGMPMFDPQAEDFEILMISKNSACQLASPFASTQDYANNAIHNYDGVSNHQSLPADEIGPLTAEKADEFGTSKFFDIVLSHPVFHSSPTDTFALRHSDLDLQNILIDEEGNVTGIIDWDGSLAMPRCVGHASVLAFLDRDFYPEPLVNSPFLCWRAGYYREIYAAALTEAGNVDVEFTTKSHIYQAVFAALYEDGDMEDLMARLVKEIDVQIDVWDLKFLLTKGCKATEEMLKKELWKVLKPQMPAEGLLDSI